MRSWLRIRGVVAGVGVAAQLGLAQSPLVSRNMTDPLASSWQPGPYNSAAGQVTVTNAVPPDQPRTGASLRIAVDYSGKGFEFCSIIPASGQIPGLCRRGSVRALVSDSTHAWMLAFKDARGRSEIDGKKLEIAIKGRPGSWTTTSFTIPPAWEQPLALSAISAHNWESKTKTAHAELLIHDLIVETDVSAVTNTASLVRAGMTGPAVNNVIVEGEPVAWTVSVDSWLGSPLAGSLTWSFQDESGSVLTGGVADVAVTDTVARAIAVAPARYGLYRLTASASLQNGTTFSRTSHLAYVPHPPVLTEEQKDLSPYGINVHGGMPDVPYQTVSRIGFAWIRDYAYSWEWMLRAKGEDGKYGGWPWYPKMDRKARGAGLRVLPILMGAMGHEVEAGRATPDQAWKAELLHILLAFPQYTVWELDNEYDYKHGREEEAHGWASYRAYHKLFSDCIQFLDPRVTAVESGTAGVYPERVRANVLSGAFDKIGVINAHFYCGARPPELTRLNANTGQQEAVPVLMADTLRELVKAAASDGRARKTWITEFGWDTLAVHIVSEKEQAAYLQRGYLMGLQAGIDRMFWYWDRDTKNKPSVFFDGCGLLDPREEPKPALAAMAGLAQRLKLPHAVGTCEFGPNTMGYVFRDQGRLVGCAFKIDPAGAEATVEFPGGTLHDLYGNALSSRKVKLDIAPVWIDDLPASDPMVLQTAYEVVSRRYIRATAGDPFTIEVQVRNQRPTALTAVMGMSAPRGWVMEHPSTTVEVAPGAEKIVPLKVAIDPRAAPGLQSMTVELRDAAVRKTIRIEVEVLPFATARTAPLAGAPGKASLKVDLRNNSLQPRDFVLTPEVPAGWSVNIPTMTLAAMPSQGTTQVVFTVDWKPAWKSGEEAGVAVLTADGTRITRAPLIPGAMPLASVSGIAFDGHLKEWPVAARLPAWATGCTHGAPDADLYAGWSPEGLYIAAEVHNSRADVMDTKAFWGGDCLEVFVDTQDNKAERKEYQPTDHQFWLCPLVKEGRVYVGRWKRSAEIAATQYDLAGVKSACRKTADGYIMEVLLPASCLTRFAPVSQGHLGLNLNLSVSGVDGELREVFWPAPKADGAQAKPSLWGVGVLR